MCVPQNWGVVWINLGMLDCLELDEASYKTLHIRLYELYFIIMFGTKLHGSKNMHLSHDAL